MFDSAVLNWRFDGITVFAVLLAFIVIAALVFTTLTSLRSLLLLYLRPLAARTAMVLVELVVDLLESTRSIFLLMVALYCASFALPLEGRASEVTDAVIQIAVLFQIGLWISRVLGFAIERIAKRQPEENEARLAMSAISLAGRIAIWSLVSLLMLSAVHINITALVAGLGVGGVAVALAVQNILGDLFASFSILLDKPFSVGHFIVVDDLAGTVEHVGIKSTRVRSLSGEEIVVPNGDLLKARIHNYRRLFERRVLFGFGVTYDTGYEKLSAIPALVREIVEGIEKTRFDRAHFKEYGDSALNFEIVYYVLDPDYNIYMDIQQRINLEIFRRFEEQGVSFAFPTRTIYVNQVNGARQRDGVRPE